LTPHFSRFGFSASLPCTQTGEKDIAKLTKRKPRYPGIFLHNDGNSTSRCIGSGDWSLFWCVSIYPKGFTTTSVPPPQKKWKKGPILFFDFFQLMSPLLANYDMTTGALSRYQAGRMAAEYIASDPTRYSKWTGWHTAGINVAGSLLLGGIAATPSIDVRKVNGPVATAATAAATTSAPTGFLPPSLYGLSPRAKLMMGVGYVPTREFVIFSILVDFVVMGQN
jgi:hypothetical protein